MSDEWQGYLRIPLGMHIIAVKDGEEVSGIVNRVTERRDFITRVLIDQEDDLPQRRIDLPPWQLKTMNGRDV